MMLPFLAFLTSRAGQYLALAALAIGVLIAAYQTGVRGERARGEAASLRNQIAVLKADLDISKRAEVSAKALASELEAKAKGNNDVLAKIDKELQQRPAANRCVLSDADARRLRSLQ